MKPITKLVSSFLILTFLIACVLTIPIGAATTPTSTPTSQAEDDVRFTKKVVSVLFDNSSSMTWSNTNEYALYAMQMLMALLSENDTLVITPIDVNRGGGASVPVDLTDPNRNGVIETIMTESFLGSTPTGGTPSSTITNAIGELVSLGLKDKDNLTNTQEDVEYWLVIITDGDFNDVSTAEEGVRSRIENYPSLKTIFLGMGPSSPEVTEFGTLSEELPFTAYRANTIDAITYSMQQVANQLSGRYTLPASSISIGSDGKTVKINLNSSDFAFKSISVIAQDCGAELVSASYKGTPMEITNPTIIVPRNPGEKVLLLQNGYSGVIKGDPYFHGGEITLTFSKEVPAEKLSILAEPALKIRSYLEYNDNGTWKSEGGMQFINANLSEGDSIRVGYEVYEQLNGSIIDVTTLPGEHTATVKYAGNSYDIGQEIPLVVGNNEIVVTVSVMDGAYTMYASTKCIIEKNPSYYNITGKADAEIPFDKGYADVVYTVCADNVPLTQSQFTNGGYRVEAIVTAPDGSTARAETQPVNSDGTVTVRIYANEGVYGTYQIKGVVTSKYEITRECFHEMKYGLGDISIKSSGATQFDNNTRSEQIKFSLFTEGKAFTKNDLAECTWTAVATKPDGTPAQLTSSVDSTNSIICKIDAQNREYGVYNIKFTLTTKDGKAHEHTHSISYYPSTVEIIGSHTENLPTGADTVESTYYVLVDGVKLTKAELEKYTWSITVTAPDGVINNVPFDIADIGDITATIDASSSGYGAYTVNAVFELIDSYRDEETHKVKNYPSSVILTIPEGGGSVTATEHQFLTNENGFKFELTADGLPFVIDNGLTVNKIVVGNVDVTQYATSEGNVWTYIPKPEHFEGGLPVGTQTVTVTINCPEVPAITANATATLTITPTVFVIEQVESPNTHVDKFLLHKTDAVLYFKVTRDGITLPLEELQAAFDNGEISVKDEKGTFTTKFWLPAAREVSVETVNGEAVIAFKVKKDIIPPFATFAAMFIFNGDRPVTASYNGASLTQNITFYQKPAHIWSYTWRILVILFIIHTTLYVIGFFNGKCKSLPKGILVRITVADDEDASFSGTLVNQTFWKRYGWHLERFFLIGQFKNKKLWYHQKPKNFSNFASLSINEDGDAMYTFSGNAKREHQFLNNGSAAFNAISSYMTNWETYNSRHGVRPNLNEIRSRDVCNIFQILPGSSKIESGTFSTGISYSFYGIYDEDTGKLAEIVFFIKQAD